MATLERRTRCLSRKETNAKEPQETMEPSSEQRAEAIRQQQHAYTRDWTEDGPERRSGPGARERAWDQPQAHEPIAVRDKERQVAIRG